MKKGFYSKSSKKTDVEKGENALDDAIMIASGEKPPATDEEREMRARSKRRKTYERPRTIDIPDNVKRHFARQGYEVRYVRWSVHGEADFRYLSKREREGYEFVTADEIPEEFLRTMRVLDTNVATGMLTNGDDLCLMKIDTELRNSRREYFSNLTDEAVDAVDVNVLRKKGYLTHGSKSRIAMKEPSFQQ